MRSMWRRAAVPVSLLAAVALAAACGGSDGGGATESGPSAQETLARAADAVGRLKSFHFVLTHEKGTTPIVLDLGLTRAEGDVMAPDRLRAQLQAKRGPVVVDVKVVAIGKDLWVTEPFRGTWQKVGEGIDIGDIFAPGTGVPELLRNARDAKAAGGETVDGVATRRVQASVDAGALRSIAPVAKEGVSVPVSLWIGRDDALVRRIRIEGRLTDQESADIRRQIDLSRFDEPVQIAPP